MLEDKINIEDVIDKYNELCVNSSSFLYNHRMSSFDRSEMNGSLIVIQKDFRDLLVDKFLRNRDIEQIYMSVESEIEYLVDYSLDIIPDYTLTIDILFEMIIFLQEMIEISTSLEQYEVSGNFNRFMRLFIKENQKILEIKR